MYPIISLIFLIIHSSLVFAQAQDHVNLSSIQALHLSWLDTQVVPSQNFDAYANGSWQKNNPIPPQYSSWGSFNLVDEKTQDLVHKIVINATKTKSAPGSLEQKIGDFYFSGMDKGSINKLGIKPIQPELAKIDAIKTPTDLREEIAHLHEIGVNALFVFGSMQDFKNSQQMIGAIMQNGLGLPDRDYYLKTDKKFVAIRQAYQAHIAKMLSFLGDSPEQAGQAAKAVMNIEMQLAKASMSQVEQRNPRAIYHLKTISEMDKLTPYFSWSTYLVTRGLGKIQHINEAMPHFFHVMNQLLNTISLADWKSYLRWQFINEYADYLSSPIEEQNFAMYSILTGTQKMLPRWKLVIKTEDSALGFAIGRIYVKDYFPPQAKQEVLAILQNIRTVLQHDLKTLSWMTPPTRKAALHKLVLMEARVGYPEKWWDYSTLKIDRGPYVLNVMRATQFLVKRDIAKIGKPIDRTEWSMTPQTINAYYDFSMNNLNIPAGILQSPFFDSNAPAAVNYGAIGFVIGHEMTHGFDDQGAQFNGYGNLKNWWAAQDLAQFNKATQCLVEQFSKYVVDDDLHVQGKLVSGEAAADLGGLILAYKAFHHAKEFKEAKVLDGFTPDQQFFLGMAHVWAMNMRSQQLRNMVLTNPHPPAKFRVNGTLANVPAFAQAFNIPENSVMVSKNRCQIW